MTKVSEKASEMQSAEATELIREIAAPVPVKVALLNAAEWLSGWTGNRIRDVFHADPRVRLTPEEILELRDAAQRKKEADGRAEYRALQQRLDRAKEALRALGSDLDV